MLAANAQLDPRQGFAPTLGGEFYELAHTLDIEADEGIARIDALLDIGREEAGGIICGRMAVLAEGDAQERSDLVYLEKLPLFNPDGSVKG